MKKKYLLVTKLFDSLFDSGENAGIAWRHYNLRPLRLMLTFKLSHILDVETAELFWKECILGADEANVFAKLQDLCDRLLRHIHNLPDKASRDVSSKGLEWARQNPESIQIFTDRRIARRGHFPNAVAFTNLLDGLDRFTRDRNRSVARITHDQQSEFETTLRMLHEMFSNASGEELRWAGETYSLQKVAGSTFEIREDQTSPGIQVADVVLWLYSQFRKGKDLPSYCESIVLFALSRGWEVDFSFAGVEREYIARFGPILEAPLSPESEKKPLS